ncbi:hypothetical protein G9A89_012332 [Geosiphon pyriformis]|nr:hypothetical protein G9A89_012332 [Geosiphon pyriformis]
MTDQSPTFYLLFVSFSIALSSFQYGYHIGELNTPQKVISCEGRPKDPDLTSFDSPFHPCIPMTAAEFSIVTSIFTLGGLFGSLLAPKGADRKGRRWTLMFNSIFLGVGSLLMGLANSMSVLIIGRILVGIGSGVAVVVVPTYLNEISTSEYRGAFGVMNQLGIVTGILFAQIEGFFLSTTTGWRLILLTGAIIAFVQVLLLGFVVESPKYLITLPNGYDPAKKSLQRLRGKTDVGAELNEWQSVVVDDGLEGLISSHSEDVQNDENGDQSTPHDSTGKSNQSPAIVFRAQNYSHDISLAKFVKNSHYRPALIAILLLQFIQQFSGINAVIFYSTTILSKNFPESSGLITVFISIVNTAVTLLSAALIDKVGRRVLLLSSIFLMTISSSLLALGITKDYGMLAAISIIAFVGTFAIGLGPIPFLINPEIVDTHAAATASSLGLSVNWISNFLVALLFLNVREIMGGNVFYVFAALLFVSFWAVKRYVPETKGKTVERVWEEWR